MNQNRKCSRFWWSSLGSNEWPISHWYLIHSTKYVITVKTKFLYLFWKGTWTRFIVMFKNIGTIYEIKKSFTFPRKWPTRCLHNDHFQKNKEKQDILSSQNWLDYCCLSEGEYGIVAFTILCFFFFFWTQNWPYVDETSMRWTGGLSRVCPAYPSSQCQLG